MASTTPTPTGMSADELQQYVEDNINGLSVHTSNKIMQITQEAEEKRHKFEERVIGMIERMEQLQNTKGKPPKEGFESGSKPDDDNLRRKVSELEAKLNGIETATNKNTNVLNDVANQVNQLGNAFTSQCAQTAALLERIANRFDGVEAKVAEVTTKVAGINATVKVHETRIDTVEQHYANLSKIAENNREAIAKLPQRLAQQSDPVGDCFGRIIKYRQAECVMNALQSASASGATSQCNVISALMSL